MPLEIVEALSLASDAENEDRCGAAGLTAWVIDGATDVLENPLIGPGTDSAWFAETLNRFFQALGPDDLADLSELPAIMAPRMAGALQQQARREPSWRGEHPSAAGLLVKLEGAALHYVAVGDCTLLVESGGKIHRFGTSEKEAGDPWVAEEIRRQQRASGSTNMAQTRATLWPKLREARALMNTDGGYGIFSITAPPKHLVLTGRMDIAPGTRMLLASDGLLRLVDVFGRFDTPTLFEAAWSSGLDALIKEVRRIERDDHECLAVPRAKTSDDATGMLIRTQ